LICIKCNQQPALRYNIRDDIDRILLNDIGECNGLLVGQVDDDNDNEDGEMSSFLMMILHLIGQLFVKLQVVGESRIYTRRKRTIKESNHQVMVLLLDLPFASKKGPDETSTPVGGKDKEKIEFGVENEMQFDSFDFEFE